MKKTLFFLLTMWVSAGLYGQTYVINYYSDAGNPGGLNTESPTTTAGWTEIDGGGASANAWTPTVAIPFNFDFYGSPVTHLKISMNGVITFDTAATLVPGDNVGLPTSALPDKSIAGFWDAFTTSPPVSTSDDIDVKTFGTAPNRQFWIRWYGYELAGNSNVYMACVLEETSNKIYVVDLNSTNASGISATVGVQLNATTGVDAGSNLSISGNASATPDNDYYELSFLPAGACLLPSHFTAVSYTSNSATIAWQRKAAGSTFDVEYGPAGFTPGTGQLITGITDTFRVVTGLNSYTLYDFYVAEDCPSGNLSPFTGPVTILTAIGAGWYENFSGTYPPAGWHEAAGLIGNPTTFSSTTSSSWSTDGFSNIGTSGAVRQSISSTSTDEWLITYSIDLPSSHNLMLEFDGALTVSGANVKGELSVDDTIHVVISTDHGATWSRTNSILTLSQSNTFYNNLGAHYTIPLSSYSGMVKIGFYAESSVTNGISEFSIDNIHLRPAVNCPQPHGLESTGVTTTTIDLSWVTNGSGTFGMEWGPAGFSQGTQVGLATNIAGNTYTITGLVPYKAYDIFLWKECSGLTSDTIGPLTVVTAIEPYWIEDFDDGNFAPLGWEERQGRIDNPTVFSSYTAGWNSDEFANITSGTFSANQLISGTSTDEWLISPLIDLGSVKDYQLEFDAAVTNSSGTNVQPFDPDDTVRIVISTDGGITWNKANTVLTMVSGSEPTNTGSHYIVNLATYTGFVKVAFYAQSTVTGASVDFFIDNVEIREVPSCPQPFGLSATGAADSVVLTWSSTFTPTYYVVEYGPAGFTLGFGTQVTHINDTNFTVTGLNFNTSYQFYVHSFCGSSSSLWTNPVTFTTPCDVIPAPLFEDFNAWRAGSGTTTTGDSISNCWTRVPNSTTQFSWRVRTGTTPSSSTGPQSDYSGGGNYVFTEAGNGTQGDIALLKTPRIDISSLNYAVLEFYYFMYGADIDRLNIDIKDGTNTFSYSIVGAQQASADPWLPFAINLSALPLASDTIEVEFKGVRGSGSVTGDIAIDQFAVKNECGKPLNLAINNLTSSSADLVWLSGSGSSHIEWGLQGYTPGAGTLVPSVTSPYTLTGLQPNTRYDFYVKDTCFGLGSSAWVGPFTFKTRCTTILNGLYTIGGPAGPRNFTTIAAAVNELNDCGVDGPVTFDIAPGTYNTYFTIETVVGASSTNTVTFNGGSAATTRITHDGSASAAVITLNGASYIRLKNLTVENTKSGTEAVGIHLANQAASNIIDSCHFILPGTSSETAHIFAGGDVTNVSVSASSSYGINAVDLTVSNSVFDRGYISVILSGNNTNIASTSGYVFENNTFNDFSESALDGYYLNELDIIGNTFNGTGTRGVADIEYISNYTITGNYIRNLGSVATFIIWYGNVAGNNVPVNGTSVVSNNIIHSTGNYSLFFYQVQSTDVVNNTLSSDASDCLYLSDVDNMKVLNNIFYAYDMPVTIPSATSGPTFDAATNQMDYNIYYPVRNNNFFNTGVPVILHAGTSYTLAEWKTANPVFDAHSLIGDPEFVSGNDRHTQGFLADNAGVVLSSVTTDFDGDLRSATTPDIGADEFSAVACPVPTTLDVANATGNSIDLTWLGSGSGYTVEWGTAGFTPGNGIPVSSTTTTVSLSGLFPGNVYDFYVRNDCSPTPSAWAGPFSFVTECSSPLSGIYTIDPSAPNSATNFTSMQSAAQALSKCGVSGPVTFNIAAGTYNGPLIMRGIAGVSATNTVLFKGTSAPSTVISSNGNEFAGNQATVLMDSTDYVTFRNLTIANTSSSAGWGVVLQHAANYNTIDSCIVQLPVTSTTNVVGIVTSNSLTSASSTGDNANYLTVSNSTITGGETGMYLSGGSANASANTGYMIVNNILTQQDDYGIRVDGQTNITIKGNQISEIQNVQGDGLYLIDINEYTILENRVKAPDYALYIDDGNDGNNPTGRSVIANNMIISENDYGMYLNDFEATDVFYNSVAGLPAIRINDQVNLNARNNIFYSTSDFAFESDDALGTGDVVDYNIYHSTHTNTFDIGPTTYADLAAWKAADATRNINSLQGDPGFIDVTADLHIERALPNNVADNTVNVTTDIDGEARSVTTPDIGADEYVPATCFRPSAVAEVSVTQNSIELTWVTGGASNWNVQYGTEGFTLGTGTIENVSAIPFTVSGLTPLTCYEFYVRDSCGAGDVSLWNGPYKVCTSFPCIITTTPLNVLGDTLICGPDATTLTATTNESLLLWSDGDGFVVEQGDSFTTGSLDRDTTFYIRDAAFSGPQNIHVGATNAATATGGFGNFSNGMMFTALGDMRLDSLTLRSDGAVNGFIRFYEPDNITNADINVANARLVQQVPYTLTAAGVFKVPVGIVFAPGRYFINMTASGGQLFRSTSGAQFPYVINNVISIDSSVGAGTFPSTRIYYFFDWVVSGVCVGPQKPVNIGVISSGFTASASASTISSAEVSWPVQPAVQSYEIEYGSIGFALNSGTRVSPAPNPYTITGMTQNLNVDVYARAIFNGAGGQDTCSWFGPVQVGPKPVACDDFEVYSAGDVALQSSLFNRWDGTGPDAPVSTAYASSGNYSIQITDTAASGETDVIAEFDPYTAGAHNIRFSFYVPTGFGGYFNVMRNYDGTGARTWAFHNYISTSGTVDIVEGSGGSDDTLGSYSYNVAQWNTVEYIIDLDNDTAFVLVNGVDVNIGWEYSLGVANAQMQFDGINFYADPDQTPNFFVDDLCITPHVIPVICHPPTALAADSIGCTSADLSWASGVAGSFAIVEYGPAGFTPGTGAGTVVFAQSPYLVSGLTPNTGYEFYVSDTCGADTSLAAGPVSFTTANGPLNASFTATLNAPTATNRTVDFNAAASAGATSYTWDFGDGSPAGSGVNVSHSYTVNQSYTVTLTITGPCGTASQTSTVVISGIGIEENVLSRSLEVYPNPTTGSIQVHFVTENSDDATINILDLSGKVIIEIRSTDLNGEFRDQIDLGRLAKGTYMLRIESGDKYAIRRIIKE